MVKFVLKQKINHQIQQIFYLVLFHALYSYHLITCWYIIRIPCPFLVQYVRQHHWQKQTDQTCFVEDTRRVILYSPTELVHNPSSQIQKSRCFCKSIVWQSKWTCFTHSVNNQTSIIIQCHLIWIHQMQFFL